MKRKLASVLGAAALALAMGAAPAGAHQAGPCNESGEPGNSDYAQHHIRPAAQDGNLGSARDEAAEEGQGHSPGDQHQGYSACDPAGD